MKKTRSTILASIFIMALVISVASVAGTLAWFSSAKSAGPTIVAGTVNLRLSKDGSTWDDSLEFAFPTGWAPGDSHEIHVYMKVNDNAGAKTVWVYGDNLGGTNLGLADVIEITDVAYTDSSAWGFWETGYTGYWVHPGGGTKYEGKFDVAGDDFGKAFFGNGFAPLTLREFCENWDNPPDLGYMRFYWGTWYEQDYLLANSGNTQQVKITFTFDEDADNTWQGKSCDFDIVFLATDDQGYGLLWPLPT